MDFLLVQFHYTISLFKNNRSYDEIDNLIFINVNKDNGFDEKDLGEYIEFYMENQYVCRWCIAKMERNSFNSCFFL